MAKSTFFKRLGQDLLKLEINTIVTSEITPENAPRKRRMMLYRLARRYSNKLEAMKCRGDIIWTFGGMQSILELEARAKEGIKKKSEALKNATTEDEKSDIERDLRMLERIQRQSDHLVDWFKTREKEKDRIKKELEKEDQIHYKKVIEEFNPAIDDIKKEDQSKTVPSDLQTFEWNNDISKELINKLPDFDLVTEDIMLIRKAWDIGTEEIVVQTTVGLDGDVTTRMNKSFAETPNETLLEIHNQAINTSIKFWSILFDSIIKIIGSAFKQLFGK